MPVSMYTDPIEGGVIRSLICNKHCLVYCIDNYINGAVIMLCISCI